MLTEHAVHAWRRARRWVGTRLANRALILAYHRIAPAETDPWSLCVSPSHFAEHLEVLRATMHPLPLRQAVAKQRLPSRSVVVTCDDGYVDALTHAKPLLARTDIPATVFVTTGPLGSAREFWWDDLDRLLLQPGTLPSTIRVTVSGTLYEWHPAGDACYSIEEQRRHTGWRAFNRTDPTIRHRIYRSIWQLMHPLPESEQQSILAQLRACLCAEPAGRPTHRSLAPGEVAALAAGDLIDIGAHTVTHPSLARLPLTQQREEITHSKQALEAILGRPVLSFAYPFGTRTDYTAQTVTLVREAGFACACSDFQGLVERHTDRFQLPRMSVHDWDGDEFARRLQGWSYA